MKQRLDSDKRKQKGEVSEIGRPGPTGTNLIGDLPNSSDYQSKSGCFHLERHVGVDQVRGDCLLFLMHASIIRKASACEKKGVAAGVVGKVFTETEWRGPEARLLPR